jgi:hypothetical protein
MAREVVLGKENARILLKSASSQRPFLKTGDAGSEKDA